MGHGFIFIWLLAVKKWWFHLIALILLLYLRPPLKLIQHYNEKTYKERHLQTTTNLNTHQDFWNRVYNISSNLSLLRTLGWLLSGIFTVIPTENDLEWTSFLWFHIFQWFLFFWLRRDVSFTYLLLGKNILQSKEVSSVKQVLNLRLLGNEFRHRDVELKRKSQRIAKEKIEHMGAWRILFLLFLLLLI